MLIHTRHLKALYKTQANIWNLEYYRIGATYTVEVFHQSLARVALRI